MRRSPSRASSPRRGATDAGRPRGCALRPADRRAAPPAALRDRPARGLDRARGAHGRPGRARRHAGLPARLPPRHLRLVRHAHQRLRQARLQHPGLAGHEPGGRDGACAGPPTADRRQRRGVAGPPAIRIEPLGNMAVVKDLVTDMDDFWASLRARRPWLFPPAASPGPDDEYRVSPEQWDVLAQGVLCLECGVCYSDCDAVAAEPRFVGPTALVKAHRYSFDPRDDAVHERAADLSGEHGLWECMRCYFCTQRCPKHIRVRELIAQLGERCRRRGARRRPRRPPRSGVRRLAAPQRPSERDRPCRQEPGLGLGRAAPAAGRARGAGRQAGAAAAADRRPRRAAGRDGPGRGGRAVSGATAAARAA